jgi:hypothetical protein
MWRGQVEPSKYDNYQRIGVYVNTSKSSIDKILSLYTIYVTKPCKRNVFQARLIMW